MRKGIVSILKKFVGEFDAWYFNILSLVTALHSEDLLRWIALRRLVTFRWFFSEFDPFLLSNFLMRRFVIGSGWRKVDSLKMLIQSKLQQKDKNGAWPIITYSIFTSKRS